jgi:hypothetical protein
LLKVLTTDLCLATNLSWLSNIYTIQPMVATFIFSN